MQPVSGEPSPSGAPSADEIRAALGRILESSALRSAPQLGAFLTYVVERSLAGQADRLKGYSIATEALGRRADFDPQTDPIVRVEATRLRRALASYYDGEGNCDPIVISMPRGSYMPLFGRAVPRQAPPQAVPTPPPTPPPIARRRLGGMATGIVAFALLLVAISALWDGQAPGDDMNAVATPGQASLPILAVETFRNETDDVTLEQKARLLHAYMVEVLAHFDEIEVRDLALFPAGERQAAAETADFILGGRFEGDARIRFVASMHEPGSGRIVWTDTRPRDVVVDDPQTVGEDFAVFLAQPYGVIGTMQLHRQLRETSPSLLGELGGYDCVLAAFDYWRAYEHDRHAPVRACLENAVASDPSFALGYAALALLRLDEYRLGYNVRPSGDPLDEAFAAARRAAALDPSSERAYLALCEVLYMRRAEDEAAAACDYAMRINPYDTDIAARYGASLVSAGRSAQGIALLDQANERNIGRPVWGDVALFFGHWLSGNREAAQAYAANIPTSSYLPGQIALAVAHSDAGRTEAALAAIGRMIEMEPEMTVMPGRRLARLFTDQASLARIEEALMKAGLVIGSSDSGQPFIYPVGPTLPSKDAG